MSTTTTNGSPRVSITSEPTTYGPHNSENSWFCDAYNATRANSESAQIRLKRNFNELRRDPPRLEERSFPQAVSYEFRAPNLTVGGAITDSGEGTGNTSITGGGFYSVLPKWLVEMTSVAARPERVLSKVCPTFSLDQRPGAFSISIPRLSTGTSTAGQQPASDVSATDVLDAATTSPILPIVGREDVPLAMLEQSPRFPAGASLDELIMKDLLSSADAQLESKVVAGAGLGGASASPASNYDLHGQTWATSDLLGITNLTGIGSVAHTTATPTGLTLWPCLGQAFANVSNNRKRRPEAWIMRGARWGWIGSLVDVTNSRPYMTPGHWDADDEMAIDGSKPIGTLLKLPVFLSEGVPVDVNNRDQILALRPSDLVLFESPPTQAVYTDVLSGTMEARIQLRYYAAWIPGRFPSSVCAITGTGQTQVANFF